MTKSTSSTSPGTTAPANTAPTPDNAGVVVPTMVSETSQGGAIPNLIVCDLGSAVGETVPAGSIFHYHLIGP